MASLPPFPLPELTPSMMRAGVFNAMPPARIASRGANPAKDAHLAARRAQQASAASSTPAPRLASREQNAEADLWAAFNGERPPKPADAPKSEADLYERVFGA